MLTFPINIRYMVRRTAMLGRCWCLCTRSLELGTFWLGLSWCARLILPLVRVTEIRTGNTNIPIHCILPQAVIPQPPASWGTRPPRDLEHSAWRCSSRFYPEILFYIFGWPYLCSEGLFQFWFIHWKTQSNALSYFSGLQKCYIVNSPKIAEGIRIETESEKSSISSYGGGLSLSLL